MSDIITVSSTKGGPGKTTIVMALADFYAQNGHSVAMVDTDPNHNLTNWYNKGKKSDLFPNITLRTQPDEEKLMNEVKDLLASHTIIFIDVAGVGSRSLVYAAGLAHLVIIPTKPSEDDFLEALKTREVVNNAARIKERPIPHKTLVTCAKPNTVVLDHVAKQLEAYKVPIFRTVITDRTVYQKARFAGSTPVSFEPKGAAAKEIKSLAQEISVELSARSQAQEPARIAV